MHCRGGNYFLWSKDLTPVSKGELNDHKYVKCNSGGGVWWSERILWSFPARHEERWVQQSLKVLQEKLLENASIPVSLPWCRTHSSSVFITSDSAWEKLSEFTLGVGYTAKRSLWPQLMPWGDKKYVFLYWVRLSYNIGGFFEASHPVGSLALVPHAPTAREVLCGALICKAQTGIRDQTSAQVAWHCCKMGLKDWHQLYLQRGPNK